MKHSLSIMIADADRESSNLLAEQITESCPEAIVSTTESGKDLIEALSHSKFDLVFLDMILPYTEISQLREAIGTFLNQTTTKLVLVSETLRPHWMTIAITLNAHEVLLKPYKPAVLSKLIETYVQVKVGHNVLIVDGSARLRALLRSAMEASEFQIAVTDADSGRRALQFARSQKFKIAFINKLLTDTSASEIGCQIMNLSSDETAIILMDAAQKSGRHSAGVLGIKETLRIPFNVTEVNRALYGALGLWKPYLINSLVKIRDLKRKASDAA